MTKKCAQCGTPHRNKNWPNETLTENCSNCSFIIQQLQAFVKAINMWVPITTGKCNRKLTIIGFKIEKI